MGNVRRLPKAELHLHLDGSVRPVTIKELAEEQGIPLPETDPSLLSSHLQANEACESLTDYLSRFDLPLRCLQSSKALRRAAFEIVEDAFLDNVKYVELRFAPLLHGCGGLSAEEAIAAMLAGLESGEQAFGITARVILICMRSHTPEMNLEVVCVARQFQGKGVVGIDLAGDEWHYPPQIHRSVFRLADRYGFPVTIHAGEAAGSENIAESITNMHACRIGHGVRLKENPELMDMVRERRIALEMCVTSNLQTKAVRSWQEHPVKEYFDSGILVTINTDNTTVSNTTLTREYERLMELYQFDFHDLKKLILNAVEASFLEGDEKRRMMRTMTAELQAIDAV